MSCATHCLPLRSGRRNTEPEPRRCGLPLRFLDCLSSSVITLPLTFLLANARVMLHQRRSASTSLAHAAPCPAPAFPALSDSAASSAGTSLFDAGQRQRDC